MSFTRGLRTLNSDNDVLQMIRVVDGCDIVDLYVEHNISGPDIIDETKIGHDIISDDDVVEVKDEDDVHNDVDDDEDGMNKDVDKAVEQNDKDGVDTNAKLDEENVEVANEFERDDEVKDVEDSDHKLDWATALPKDTTRPYMNDFDHGEDSDQLQTPHESEDDEEYERFPTYKVGEGIKFELDMRFNTKDMVKDVTKEYAMLEKKYLPT
ncbi:unnamed protein product [Lathyrus sativus]|nr:unnamed protein product [Lathyrus sativus]